jgi:hypothetical protein
MEYGFLFHMRRTSRYLTSSERLLSPDVKLSTYRNVCPVITRASRRTAPQATRRQSSNTDFPLILHHFLLNTTNRRKTKKIFLFLEEEKRVLHLQGVVKQQLSHFQKINIVTLNAVNTYINENEHTHTHTRRHTVYFSHCLRRQNLARN